MPSLIQILCCGPETFPPHFHLAGCWLPVSTGSSYVFVTSSELTVFKFWIVTLGFIFEFQLNWKACIFKVGRWSHKMRIPFNFHLIVRLKVHLTYLDEKNASTFWEQFSPNELKSLLSQMDKTKIQTLGLQCQTSIRLKVVFNEYELYLNQTNFFNPISFL